MVYRLCQHARRSWDHLKPPRQKKDNTADNSDPDSDDDMGLDPPADPAASLERSVKRNYLESVLQKRSDVFCALHDGRWRHSFLSGCPL